MYGGDLSDMESNNEKNAYSINPVTFSNLSYILYLALVVNIIPQVVIYLLINSTIVATITFFIGIIASIYSYIKYYKTVQFTNEGFNYISFDCKIGITYKDIDRLSIDEHREGKYGYNKNLCLYSKQLNSLIKVDINMFSISNIKRMVEILNKKAPSAQFSQEVLIYLDDRYCQSEKTKKYIGFIVAALFCFFVFWLKFTELFHH